MRFLRPGEAPLQANEDTLPRASHHLLHPVLSDLIVHAFGSLMLAGADGPVRRTLVEAVSRWASPTAICETGAGDSVLIADDDAVAMAHTARHLMDEVYTAPGQPRLRIALHHGEVNTRQRDRAPGSDIVGGEAVLCAARVEPFVAPGQVWVT